MSSFVGSRFGSGLDRQTANLRGRSRRRRHVSSPGNRPAHGPTSPGRLAAGAVTVVCPGVAPPAGAQPARPIVAAAMTVEDRAGRRPVAALKLAEVEIVQDAERQQLTVLRPMATPGQYEVQYVPASGRPGAMRVRVLRPGARVRGLTTQALQPLIPAAADRARGAAREPARDGDGLERLERAGGSAAIRARRQGAAPDGRVEVATRELQSMEQPAQLVRLQVLARFRDAAGRVRERLAFDRSVESSAAAPMAFDSRFAWLDAPAYERMVWTGICTFRRAPTRRTSSCTTPTAAGRRYDG
jgi:hypothetical protein